MKERRGIEAADTEAQRKNKTLQATAKDSESNFAFVMLHQYYFRKFVILMIQFNCLIFKPGQGRRQGEKEEVQRCNAKGFRQRERRTQDGNQLGKHDGCPM